MAKLTLNRIGSFASGLVATLNTNLARIEAALENTLSRDGTSPNTMNADIDMNSQRIYNLPAPTSASEPARLQDIQNLGEGISITEVVDNLTSSATTSALSANQGRVLKEAIDTKYVPVVIDNLLSEDGNSALSANQGRVLAGQIDAIVGEVGSFPVVVDDLVTANADAALSANQGVEIKELIDNIDTRTEVLEAAIMPALTPEAYGAVGDGTTDDTAAFLLCAAACVSAKAKMTLSGKNYVVSDTIPLDNGGSTFIGYPVEGVGKDATRIKFKPSSISTPCFKMTGGAGNTTNKTIRGLTIEAFDSSYNGLGIGVQVQDQCFSIVEDVQIENLAVGIEIVNAGSGGFSEFNTFRNIRLLDNTRGIQFHRRGSALDSFHGNEFHTVQINVPSGGYGLYLNGTSIGGTAKAGTAYIYNCVFNLKIFGGSGTRYAIYTDTINSEGNTGTVHCEATLTIDGTGGVFAVDGLLYSISTINKGAGAANIRFSRFMTGKIAQTPFSAFSNANINAFTPYPMGDLNLLEKVNTVGPALFPMRGTDRESIGMAFYNGSTANGLYLLTGGFGSTDPTTLTPGLKLQHDGGAITSYSGKFVLNENGVSDQLVLDDGRVGGKIGRLPATAAVTASAGVPQTIPLWTTNNGGIVSYFYIRITTASFTDYDHRVLGMFYRGPSGVGGRVIIIDQYMYYNTTSGAVSTTPTFVVDTSGVLQMTITTDRTLAITGGEISLGTVLTA